MLNFWQRFANNEMETLDWIKLIFSTILSFLIPFAMHWFGGEWELVFTCAVLISGIWTVFTVVAAVLAIKDIVNK